MADYQRIASLAAHQSFPEDGILTRALHDDDVIKVVLFTFSAGQELSEHTASYPATMHFLDGTGTVLLGGDEHEYGSQSWIHMPPRLTHAIRTRTPTRMLLYLIKAVAQLRPT